MSAAIFSSSKVKVLKAILQLLDQGEIHSGTTDPSSSAVDAPAGSIYINTSNGFIYRKLDSGSSTNWIRLGREMKGTSSEAYFTVESTSDGATAISRTMPGIELTAKGMNTTNKYSSALKGMSTDPQFTTENPKLLVAMVPRATESYTGDTNGGCVWDYFITPNTPGATNVPVYAGSIKYVGGALSVYSEGSLSLKDGVTAPSTSAGEASIYVDTADGDLKVKFGDGTEKLIVPDESISQNLTISSGAVTVTNSYTSFVTLSSEGGAATDDLDTINGGFTGQLIVVRSSTSAQDITFTSSGNMTLRQPFTTLSSADTITFVKTTGNWVEVSRSASASSGVFNFASGGTLTIATGVLTINPFMHSRYFLETEGAAATDDLDTITATGAAAGDVLVLHTNSSARDVVCKDATGNLRLAGDFTLSNPDDRIMLMYNGTNWCEMSRSDNSA